MSSAIYGPAQHSPLTRSLVMPPGAFVTLRGQWKSAAPAQHWERTVPFVSFTWDGFMSQRHCCAVSVGTCFLKWPSTTLGERQREREREPGGGCAQECCCPARRLHQRHPSLEKTGLTRAEHALVTSTSDYCNISPKAAAGNKSLGTAIGASCSSWNAGRSSFISSRTTVPEYTSCYWLLICFEAQFDVFGFGEPQCRKCCTSLANVPDCQEELCSAQCNMLADIM